MKRRVKYNYDYRPVEEKYDYNSLKNNIITKIGFTIFAISVICGALSILDRETRGIEALLYCGIGAVGGFIIMRIGRFIDEYKKD